MNDSMMPPSAKTKDVLIFFLRRYNDIDHAVPVIDRLADSGRFEIHLLSITPEYDLRGDPRIQYLAGKGLETRYLHRQVRGLLAGIFSRLVSVAAAKTGRVSGLLKRFGFKLAGSRLAEMVYSDRWAERWLGSIDPDILIFDWQMPKGAPVKSLLRVATNLKIPKIALPHGADISINQVLTWNDLKEGGNRLWARSYADFDRVVVPNRWRALTVAKAGYPEDRIDILGGARFSEQGRTILQKCLKRPAGKDRVPAEKLCVLFLYHQPEFLLYPDRIVRTIARLSRSPAVDLVIKPTTGTRGRGQHKKDFLEHAAESENLPLRIASDAPTIELVDQADAVIGVVTSAVMEAYLQGKELIIPRHLEENVTIFEEFEACWVAHDDEQLVSILERIKAGEKFSGTDPQARKRLITEWVQGGNPREDVLGTYQEYIERLIEIRRRPVDADANGIASPRDRSWRSTRDRSSNGDERISAEPGL